MVSDFPILSFVIWFPIIAGVALLFAGSKLSSSTTKLIAMVVSLLTFVLSIPLYLDFDSSTHAMQFVEKTSWIEVFNINYHLGIDGIALPLILLTTFTTLLVVLAAWESITDRLPQYLGAFLIPEWIDGGGLLCPGCDPFLCLLGGDAHPDVHDHWDLGRLESYLCNDQVFSLYIFWISFHVGGLFISLQQG